MAKTEKWVKIPNKFIEESGDYLMCESEVEDAPEVYFPKSASKQDAKGNVSVLKSYLDAI